MRSKSTQVKAKIITLTIREIQAHGANQISLRKITKQLGITTGAFYKHFKNKSELFVLAVQQISKMIYDRIYPDVKDYQEHPEQSLITLGKDIIQQFDLNSNLMQFTLFNSKLYHDQNLIQQLPFLKISKKIIMAAIQSQDPKQVETTFIQLWSFIQGYGNLISNHIYPLDDALMNDTLHKLLEAGNSHA